MSMKAGERPLLRTIGLICAAALVLAPRASSAPAQSLPERIADSTFWRMTTQMSEPGGYFRSNNFASNEWTFQYVIPEILRTTKTGGVYLGVGPDQNYTYIANMKPRIAFILDIRRQNMMLHLMYKAFMEMSPDRVTFAARLFGRTKPNGVDSNATADAVIGAVFLAPRGQKMRQENLAALFDNLLNKHGFRLSSDDSLSITFVHSMFDGVGPGITYEGSGSTPTWWDLQVENDGAAVARAYMASEANYRTIRQMHERNLIIPVVGDFGGPSALRSIGKYLNDNRATVTAFYLSNVEQYLFQSDAWYNFYSSVAALPLDSSSTFIRSVFNNQGGFRMADYGRSPAMLLGSMLEQSRLFREGRLNSYAAVINTSR
jgi:hypothetical protein